MEIDRSCKPSRLDAHRALDVTGEDEPKNPGLVLPPDPPVQLRPAKRERAQRLYAQVQAWKERGKQAVALGNRRAAETCHKHVARLLRRLERFGKTGKL